MKEGTFMILSSFNFAVNFGVETVSSEQPTSAKNTVILLNC